MVKEIGNGGGTKNILVLPQQHMCFKAEFSFVSSDKQNRRLDPT